MINMKDMKNFIKAKLFYLVMRRKLIKQGGGGGLTFYVPKKWADKQGLKAGDDIEISEEKQGLLLQAEASVKRKEGSIEITSKDKRFLQYILNNYYRAGYDKIILSGSVNEKHLYDVLQLLSGFEISEIDNHKAVIEIMAEPFEDKFEVLMKQLFFIIKQDFDHIIESIKEIKEIDFDRILINSKRAIKNSNLCLRFVSKRLSDLNGFNWTIINLLTWIERQLYYLSKSLKDKKMKKINHKQMKYLESIRSSIDYLYDGIYKRSLHHFMKIHLEYRRWETERYNLVEMQNSYCAIIITHFNMIYRYIFQSTSSAIGKVTM